MEEERVVGARIFYQPVHGPQDVRLGRLAHRVLLIVGEKNHVFALVAKVLVEVGAHVLDIIDTSAQLAPLPEVVDANEQGLALTGAVRVLERIAGGSAMTEGLGLLWGRRRRRMTTLRGLVNRGYN